MIRSRWRRLIYAATLLGGLTACFMAASPPLTAEVLASLLITAFAVFIVAL